MSKLDVLLAKIQELAEPAIGADNARVSILDFGTSIHIDFHGSPFDEPYACLCEGLIDEAISGKLASLRLSSPMDAGANGTRNWDLDPLLKATNFPSLRQLKIEQNVPGNHNRVIVASMYEEDGVLARLIEKTPRLESLVVPSAPDIRFFATMLPSLTHLSVDAGYDTQGFVRNLAESTCFQSLRYLEFGEYNETYMDNFLDSCTSLADYERLFESEAFRAVRHFTLRNPQLTDASVNKLRALRPSAQFTLQVVKWSSSYIRVA